MSRRGVDMLWVSTPEDIGYLTGHANSWYHDLGPTNWHPVGGIAVHRTDDPPLVFDDEDESLLVSHLAFAPDLRVAPNEFTPALVEGDRVGADRGGFTGAMGFIVDSLRVAGWLGGNSCAAAGELSAQPCLQRAVRSGAPASRLHDRRRDGPCRNRAPPQVAAGTRGDQDSRTDRRHRYSGLGGRDRRGRHRTGALGRGDLGHGAGRGGAVRHPGDGQLRAEERVPARLGDPPPAATGAIWSTSICAASTTATTRTSPVASASASRVHPSAAQSRRPPMSTARCEQRCTRGCRLQSSLT